MTRPIDIRTLQSRDAVEGDKRLTLDADNNLLNSKQLGKPLSEAEIKALPVRDALVTDRQLTLDAADEFVMTSQPSSTPIRNVVTFSGVESPAGVFTHTLQASDISEGAETLVVIASLTAGQTAILRIPGESEVPGLSVIDTILLDNAVGQGVARISGSVSLPKTASGDSSIIARKFAADLWLVNIESGAPV